ncbi:MAG: serine/threonine-protein phosphatase [Bacteroidales bacterium]|nr:serine/threonine-protein phosphatase [Bacteroidales bacterium]
MADENEQRHAWQTLDNTIKQANSFFDRNETTCVELSKFVSLLENDTTLLYHSLTQLLENKPELRAAFIHFYDSTQKRPSVYLMREQNQIRQAVFNDYISEMRQKSLQALFERSNMSPFWENPVISMMDNQACINLFVPFSDPSNQLQGFAGLTMSLAWVDDILRSSLTYYENDAHAFMFMLAPDGSAVSVAGDVVRKNQNLLEETQSVNNANAQPVNDANTQSGNDNTFISMLYNMRNGETESIKLHNTLTSTANMFFYKSLTNKRLSIALSYYNSQSMAAWNRLFILILALLVFFFGIITLWLWWYWKKRAEIVEKMGESIESIERGSVSAIFPSSSLHQDLQELCLKVNNMQRGLIVRKQESESNARANERSKYEVELAQKIRRYFYSAGFQFYSGDLAHKINQYVKKDYLTDSVGGDFHDYFNISPQRICFVVGNVSRPKKGNSNIQTAMNIILTMNLIRSHFKAYSTLDQCVFYLNNDLYSQCNGSFTVNAFIGIIDCETGRLETVCAGAPTPCIIAHCSLFFFPAQNGLPLASRLNEEYSADKRDLSDGDMLMVHTEGVHSRQNVDNDQYGQARLRQTMSTVNMASPDVFLEDLFEKISDFTKNQPMQVDDYTLFAIKYEEKTR